MNEKQIKQRIVEIANYYNKPVTTATLDIYAQYLADMDEETFERAIDRHIQHSEWMPKVSQIREAAMLNFVDRAGVPSPAEAWSETSRHLHDDKSVNVGTLTNVNRINDHQWSHPIVKRAAEMLGWQDLWFSKNDNVVSNRARYMDTYKQLLTELKQQIQHTPDLRAAIRPEAVPQLPDPQPKQIKRDKPTLQEIRESDEYGPHTMPDHVREKFQKLLKDKEAK